MASRRIRLVKELFSSWVAYAAKESSGIEASQRYSARTLDGPMTFHRYVILVSFVVGYQGIWRPFCSASSGLTGSMMPALSYKQIHQRLVEDVQTYYCTLHRPMCK